MPSVDRSTTTAAAEDVHDMYSIILLAVADHHYRFLYLNVEPG